MVVFFQEVSVLSIPVIVIPESVQKALVLSAITAEIKQANSDLPLEMHRALLKGVVWVVGTLIAAMGIQTAVLSYFIRQ